MQESTGKIISAEKLKLLNETEKSAYRELTVDEYNQVKKMNRAERRAWAKRNPKKSPAASDKGE